MYINNNNILIGNSLLKIQKRYNKNNIIRVLFFIAIKMILGIKQKLSERVSALFTIRLH